jgi:AraC-like DNA-binding protein
MSARLHHIKDWNAIAINCHFQLQAMAKKVGVSERTLRRHFQKIFGVNAKAWVDASRAAIAAEYLLNGEPVKMTAAELNFTQSSHFSKFFKRLSGSAPGTFVADN